MKALLAVTHHNIDAVFTMIGRLTAGYKVSVIDVDAKILAPTSGRHVLLIPGAATFRSNARVLAKCPLVVPIVFDAPVLCKELGANMLDIQRQNLDFVFTYKELTARDLSHALKTAFATEGFSYKPSNLDVGSKLLKRVYGSVIASFLTCSYRITNTDRRNELQKEVFDLWWNADPKAVAAFVTEKYPSRNDAAKDFAAAVLSDIGMGFWNAVQRMKKLKTEKKPINYDKLAKEFKVSAYDLRYYGKTRR